MMAVIDLVEGRQHRGRLLGLDEPAGNRLATARHPDALFTVGTTIERRCGGRLSRL
jgi:hypothetical protein